MKHVWIAKPRELQEAQEVQEVHHRLRLVVRSSLYAGEVAVCSTVGSIEPPMGAAWHDNSCNRVAMGPREAFLPASAVAGRWVQFLCQDSTEGWPGSLIGQAAVEEWHRGHPAWRRVSRHAISAIFLLLLPKSHAWRRRRGTAYGFSARPRPSCPSSVAISHAFSSRGRFRCRHNRRAWLWGTWTDT
jgi:hypothetical protein